MIDSASRYFASLTMKSWCGQFGGLLPRWPCTPAQRRDRLGLRQGIEPIVKSLTPSSRLVLAVVAFALLVLAVAGALRPGTSGPTGSATGAGVAGPSASDAGAAGSFGGATDRPPSPKAPGAGRPPTPKPAACTPTDQDQYVYHPYRLAVQAACIRVTGTIAAIRHEADGDLHVLLSLDPAFAHLLTGANEGVELGDLVVEPVCVDSVTQTDAIASCAADPDPLSGALPVIGDTVWMEGRYAFDLQHGGWAELHPLYRWGYR